MKLIFRIKEQRTAFRAQRVLGRAQKGGGKKIGLQNKKSVSRRGGHEPMRVRTVKKHSFYKVKNSPGKFKKGGPTDNVRNTARTTRKSQSPISSRHWGLGFNSTTSDSIGQNHSDIRKGKEGVGKS